MSRTLGGSERRYPARPGPALMRNFVRKNKHDALVRRFASVKLS